MERLTTEIIERILSRLPLLSIGVVGDLFLDQYLDLDPRFTEKSIETGLDAYQIVRIRNQPGAAGTILNNLAALGVGRVVALSILGKDAHAFALKDELARRRIEASYLMEAEGRFTPTYTKPMLGGQELNRLDLKNRTPTPMELEERIIDALPKFWSEVQALVVLDQVSEENCGVLTARVRDALGRLGAAEPKKLLLADSRERIGLFRNCWLKANEDEARKRVGPATLDWEGRAQDELARKVGEWSQAQQRPIFCTRGDQGMLLAFEGQHDIPAYAVAGPIDTVGAGDSVSAGIACAYAAGATLPEAAAFGNLIASITIRQLGTTGTATPAQVRQRWAELSR